MNYFTIWKKSKIRYALKSVKKALILMLAFTVGIANVPIFTVKAANNATFDFENSTTGSINVGDPPGVNKSVTQTVSGHTLTVTQDSGNLLTMDASQYNGDIRGNLNGNILIIDGSQDVTNKLTITVNGGFIFDLSRITVMDQNGAGIDLKFQTSKGSVTTSITPSPDGQVLYFSEHVLQGVSSVDITNNSGGTILLELDDIILDNISSPLSQVDGVTLSPSGVASWNNVANESNFEVQLYKDGNPQGAAVMKAADTISHDFLQAMRAAGAGVYTVKVKAKGDGINYFDGIQSAASGSQTITKLTTVTHGLTWTGDVAHWTTVPSAVSYDVQLYKNGNPLNPSVNVVASSATSGVDFAAIIAALGGGTYAYKVTAKGNETLLLDSAQSEISDNNIKSISNDASLSGLSISSGAFNESFASGTIEYTASVGNEVSSVTVTPTVNESHATVTVGGIGVTNGQPSSSISLNIGENIIPVVVTAQDETTIKTYTIAVTRLMLPPSAPTSLSANAGDGQVSLSWNNISGATSYKVYQGTETGVYGSTPVATVTGTGTNTTITGLSNGSTYYFVVKASNAGGDSANSNEVSGTPQVAAPGAPVGLSANAGDGQVNLSWNNVSGATSYKVYQGTETGVYGSTTVATVTGTNATITGLSNGSTYYFVVKASNAGGDSANSNEASGMPSASADIVAPTVGGSGIITASNATHNSVDLSWSEGSDNVTTAMDLQYKVVQSASNNIDTVENAESNGETVQNWSENLTSKQIAGLNASTTYYFNVLIKDGAGNKSIYTMTSEKTKAAPTTSYTVSFNVDGGTPVGSQTINHNEKASKPTPDPTKIGYNFKGWYTDNTFATEFDFANTAITGTTTVYAKWTANPIYTLTYISGANGSITGVTSQTVKIGENGTPVTAVPNAGYHFVNWNDGVTTATRIDRNISANISAIANFAADIPPTPDPDPKPEEIVVDITDGKGDEKVSQTEIKRTTEKDGTKKDNVQYTEDKAKETVDKLKNQDKDTARIVIPDIKDEVSEAKIGVPNATIDVLAKGGINLEIDTENARITVPKESVKDLSENVTGQLKDDLYFRVVPIREEKKQEEIKERAKQEEVVQKVAGNSNIAVVGRPMTIETNMSQRQVDIILPLKGVNIPTDPVQKEAFLKELAIFIEHSDGEKVLTRGEVVEYKPGVLGLKFRINKFSTFTIIKIDTQNSTISPETVDFDKNTSKQVDISTTITLNGNTLSSIVNGSKTLVNGTDYEVKNNVVTVKKSYLSQQTVGTTTLIFNFNAGATQTLVIAVKDTTPSTSGGSGGGGGGGSTVPTPVKAVVERLFGQDRVDTALAIAKATYSGKISKVILASSENYPDALSGSVLAYKFQAPILLVGSSAKDQEKVIAYMKSNMDSAGTVYILGGSGAISNNMESKINEAGFKNVNRIGGKDRYETATKIADTVGVKEGTPIVIVSGENYPDALSISSIAAINQYPIFMVNKDEINEVVKEQISIIKPSKVYIIGLQGSISTGVENQLSQTMGIDKTNIVRIGGLDRFETSLNVAKYFNLSGNKACVASGKDFPDALAGSSYAANNNAPVILLDDSLTEEQKSYLKNSKLKGITIFGGEGSVSKELEDEFTKIFK